MAQPLSEAFDADRDLVSFVGAGGKTTLTFGLARQLHRNGRTVIVTTTTKMGSDQDGGLDVLGPDEAAVRAALGRSGACLVVGAVDGHKALGVSPGWVDEAFSQGWSDAVVVEADGARRRKVKAPERYEPVIPPASTVVVAVMSMAAVGGVIGEVAHRPAIVAAVVGATAGDRFTEDHAATLLTSDRGGRKSVPDGARFMVAVTDVSEATKAAALRIAERIDPVRAVLFEPFTADGEVRVCST